MSKSQAWSRRRPPDSASCLALALALGTLGGCTLMLDSSGLSGGKKDAATGDAASEGHRDLRADQPRDVVADRARDAARPDSSPPDRPPPDQRPSDKTPLDQHLPDKALPDQHVPDKALPDQHVPDKMLLDQHVPDRAPPDKMLLDAYAPPAPPPGCNKPTPIVASCAGGLCTIPAGCFLMGSAPTANCRDADEVHHWVILTRGFVISSTEVTQDQFQQALGYNPASFTACGGSCPVENVTWHEAAAYANARSTTAGLAHCYSCTGAQAATSCATAVAYRSAGKTIYDCQGYRLPTEAEWEYAYRAGTTTDFYNGAISSCAGVDTTAALIGWTSSNAQGSTHPTAQKLVNGWGLYDVAGNVEEWVHDGYVPYPAGPATDPVLPRPDATSFSVRGGQWLTYPADMRAADRNKTTEVRRPDVGFRVARTQ